MKSDILADNHLESVNGSSNNDEPDRLASASEVQAGKTLERELREGVGRGGEGCGVDSVSSKVQSVCLWHPHPCLGWPHRPPPLPHRDIRFHKSAVRTLWLIAACVDTCNRIGELLMRARQKFSCKPPCVQNMIQSISCGKI